MKKSTYVTMIIGTIGSVIFALGMCMVLIPEWSLFTQGVWVGSIGILSLVSAWLIWRRLENRPPIKFSKKMVNSFLIFLMGCLCFGIGMCFAMVWGRILLGVLIGLVGMVLLMSLIPYIKGIKE